MNALLTSLAVLLVVGSYSLVGARFGRANVSRAYQAVADDQRQRYPALYPSTESVFTGSFAKSNASAARGLYLLYIAFWPIFAWRWNTNRRPSAFALANPGRQAALEDRVRELERELGIKS